MRSKANIKSHPIHPMLITFPIGLWIASFVFNALGLGLNSNLFWAAGFYCIIGGCIGAAAAAIPGIIDLFSTIPGHSSARSRGYLHGGINTIALLLFIYIAYHVGNAAQRPDTMTLVLSGAGIIGILFSSWLGGTLVYRNQIGIDHRYANAGRYRERNVENWSRPVCNQAELSEGQMMLIKIGSERIAVGRCADGVFAFSDHCTHRGGPLSDGALVGCAMQCPWHGSQFDIRTGRVIAGPAQEPIKTYEIEIRAGEVYIKNPLEHPQDQRAA